MTWLQISLDVPTANDIDRFEQALLKAGALSVTLEDAADQPVLEPGPGETPLWAHTRMIGLFTDDADVEAIRNSLGIILGTELLSSLSVSPLEDRDWSRAWMDNFHPMSFGARLWVCPEGFEPPEPNAVNLRLDPGLAFGTGTHATTALCLQWLDEHDLQDLDVIDYGCGSGVLAIAALLLGAHHAWAVDTDPQALIATRENAQKNGVENRISVASPNTVHNRKVDVLLANILAGPLIELAPRLAVLVAEEGSIVLSGVLEHQGEEVEKAYGPWFDMKPAVIQDGWARLEGTRK